MASSIYWEVLKIRIILLRGLFSQNSVVVHLKNFWKLRALFHSKSLVYYPFFVELLAFVLGNWQFSASIPKRCPRPKRCERNYLDIFVTYLLAHKGH